MYSSSQFRLATFWAGIFFILCAGIGSAFMVYADDVVPPPPVDLCANVPGDQADEPCADTACVADGGMWIGASCDVVPPVESGGDGGAGGGGASADPAMTTEAGTDTTIATSTDGTGGLIGGTIVTGDAMATTTAQNELNTNSANGIDQPGETNSSTIENENTNEADLESFAFTTAETGENQADGGTSIATIVTGNAVSTANVINVVNTNIFNSQGIILFLNQLFGGALDLRDFNLSYFFDQEAGASPTVNEETGEPQCTLLTCLNSSALNVINTNTATVTNSVIVRASTGENAASSTGSGSAGIDTGDAYAAANVVNLVNTNIVNSSYLLVSFNNFGDLAGDITLPNADFFGKLFMQGGSAPSMNASSYTVNNTNNLDFVGTTTAESITGDNVATSTGLGHGEVTTGEAYSSATTITEANGNYFGGTSVFFLFHVMGDWTGEVKGLPAGLSWGRTDTGDILVMSDNSGVELPKAPRANCEEPDDTEDNPLGLPISNCYNSSHFLASSTNDAVIENNVDVTAVTGLNESQTEHGTSTVSTGSAYAAANVLNMINTNIVGRNWMFAVFNVMGDWSGDISFGQSNLELQAVAEAPQTPALPGSEVSYRFTVVNNGDADANNITLNTEFNKDMLTFDTSGNANALQSESGLTWNLGRVARGETREFIYRARVGDVPTGTSLTVPLTATIQSDRGAAANVNFTLVTLDVVNPAPVPAPTGGGGGGPPMGGIGGVVAGAMTSNVQTSDPDISIIKTANIGTSTVPATVDYKVVVTNKKTAGPAYMGLLTDTLYDTTGAVMYNRSWDLSTIEAGDQITLTYSVEFASSTLPGAYKNVARVTGMRGNPGSSGSPMAPVEASREVVFGINGQVLGASTTTVALATTTPEVAGACAPLITSFLKPGKSNKSSDVVVLQTFLNGQGLNVPATGFFGPMTTAAVKSFQIKYASEILGPAGLSRPTGNVFALTQKKINELNCGGVPIVVAPVAPVSSVAAPTPKLQKKPQAAAPKQKATAAPLVASPTPQAIAKPATKKSGLGGWLEGLFPIVSADSI